MPAEERTMGRAGRAAIIATVAVLAALAGGCGSRNIVFEELQQPFNRYAVRDTAVLVAAERVDDRIHFLANGSNYYDYPRYYEPFAFHGPYYGRWYYEPLVTEPYYYEVFLNVVVRDFPPKGQKRDLSADEITVVLGRLDEGTVLTRLVLEAASASAWWDKDSPAVTFEAGHDGGDSEYHQRQVDEFGQVQSRALTVLLAPTRVRATLVGPLSQERVFQITRRFDKLGVTGLMTIPE
jgi:hypothetical protein